MPEREFLGVDNRDKPRSPSSEFSWKNFGGDTTKREIPTTVGTSPQQILSNNPNRVFWYVGNRSSANGDIAFNAGLGFGAGILLTANSGFVSQSVVEDGSAVAEAVYGISGAAGAAWYVYEIVRR